MKKTDNSITLPSIKVGEMLVTIRGVTPLLVNRFSEEAQEEIAGKQEGRASLKREPRDPDAIFRGSLHAIDADAGRYGFPSAGLKKSLVAAGGRFADQKMTELRGAVNINADLLEIRGSPPERDSRPVRIPSSGTWTIGHRARFAEWEMDVPVTFLANHITPEQVVNLFRLAGFGVGIGAHRPETNGPHGQFVVGDVRVREG